MKRVLFLFIIIIAAIGYLSAGTITVTKPATNENVGKSGSYTIRWNKSGTQQEKVKIRLFNSTGSTRVASIVDDAPNNGSYEWRNRSGIADGNYVVVVKTLDNSTSGQSGVFSLGNGVLVMQIKPFRQVKLLVNRPDFDVLEIYLDGLNTLRVKIKNLGSDWKGKLALRCGVGSRKLEFVYPDLGLLTIGKNQVIDIKTKLVVKQSDVSCPNPKVLLVARIDPFKKISETDEQNNVHSVMYPHNLGPDYIIKGFKAVRSLSKLCLLIKNQGTGNRGPVKLKVVDTATNGSEINLLKNIPDFFIPAGQEILVPVGRFSFKSNLRVKAEIISGQFNCEPTDKRNNNHYDGILELVNR